MTDPSEPGALRIARETATLGLPVPEGARFRLAKRILYKISWVFLRHQVEFNQRTVQTLGAVALDQQRLRRTFEELSQALEDKLEFGLRHADREMGDQVASLRSHLTQVQIQLEQLRRGRSGRGGPQNNAAFEPRQR